MATIALFRKASERFRDVHITHSRLPNNFWEWLVLQNSFRRSIRKQGYYEVQKETIIEIFEKWCQDRKSDYQIDPKYGPVAKLPMTFQSASFDFYSQTPDPLKNLDLFVIRTGKGNCIIFDSHVFSLPYGGMLTSQAFSRELRGKVPRGYRNVVNSISKVNEQSFLRLLHFSGVFGQITKHICGVSDYRIGPSGHASCSFPFWMKDVKRKKLIEFEFEGTCDLDECIYPRSRNVVIPIEAKIYDYTHNALGWHKLAFPCYRFIDNSKSARPFKSASWGAFSNKSMTIVPVYCAYVPSSKMAFIHILPKVRLHTQTYYGDIENGLILNDEKQFRSSEIFMFDMSKYSPL